MRIPVWHIESHYGIGTEGGKDISIPLALANGLMIFQRIRGRVGGAEGFDVEAFEERSG